MRTICYFENGFGKEMRAIVMISECKRCVVVMIGGPSGSVLVLTSMTANRMRV